MKLKITTLLATLTMLTACGPAEQPQETPAATAPTTEPEPLVLPEVDAARILADATYLAADDLRGRDTGSPEYDTAAAFVATNLAEAGLLPAGTEGFLQPVPYLRRQLVEGSAELVLHHPDGDVTLRYPEDFLMAGDTVRSLTRVTAPLVFVGYGVVAPELGVDDYAGLDVDGKIIVALSGAPPSFPSEQRAYYSSSLTKAESAVAAGAVGWIGISTHIDRERRPWERSMRFAGRPGMAWLSESGEASRYYPQIAGSASLSPDAADALIASTGREPAEFLAEAEGETYTAFEFGFEATIGRETQHRMLSSPNVIGLLPGSDPLLADEYVLYTAHLDHTGICPADDSGDEICNGFYDNAMGSAILLETARVMSRLQPRRSVLFALVSGEEKGLLGADYYAHYPTVPIGSIVANINLDMPVLTAPTEQVVAFGGEHSSLGPSTERALAAAGWTRMDDPMPEEVIFVRSDHYMLVRMGIPAIYLDPGSGGGLMDFIQEHYHRPSDQPGLPVDLPSLATFTAVNALIGKLVADTEARPSWNEGNFFGERFSRRP
jgi:peptidase M28-like protein